MDQFKRTVGGAALSIWLLMATVLCLFPVTHSDDGTISVADRNKIEKGLGAGKAILDFINTLGANTLGAIARNIGPFLGAFAPFLNFVVALIPSRDTRAVALLKEMMKQVDNRFNRIDYRFDTIERLIKWNEVAVNFGQIEQKILAMDAEFRLLYKSSAPAANKKRVYAIHFESDFQLSGLKLYNAIMHTHGVFQENLGESVMRYTENDRKKTQDFLLGIMRLLLQAIKIELTYYNVKGYPQIAEHRKNEWETRILAVKSKYEEIDNRVRDKYHDQSLTDIRRYSVNHYGESHSRFSEGLHRMLKEKYYWRVWFVIAYNQIQGSDKHAVKVCGGHILSRQDGRNIVVASVDRNARSMNVHRMISRLNVFINSEHARNAFNRIDKTGACSVAVITHRHSAVSYKGDSTRIIDYNLRPTLPEINVPYGHPLWATSMNNRHAVPLRVLMFG